MDPLISSSELRQQLDTMVVLDCRFSLADSGEGREQYHQAHIPSAHYLHLDEDLSGPKAKHGGRHPLPEPQDFCNRLARLGIGTDTAVVAYDNSRFAFASRLWWMMRALGYTNVRVLNGGLNAWTSESGEENSEIPQTVAVDAHQAAQYAGVVDIDGVRTAQADNALLVDSREEKRYQGLEEPIDPVAGHIPGALNYPWQGVTADSGLALSEDLQRQRWQELADEKLVVYCGSGVTACVNLLSLAIAGRGDALLYAGSWSDWCSRLPPSTSNRDD
jgi:thiosulfate/3-mercaptopyruvate sulfurtransferase